MQSVSSVRTAGHHAQQSRPSKAPVPSLRGTGVLSIRVHYEGQRPYWALCERGEPRILFPATATGYMRASGLLEECRELLLFPSLEGTCPVTRTFCLTGETP